MKWETCSSKNCATCTMKTKGVCTMYEHKIFLFDESIRKFKEELHETHRKFELWEQFIKTMKEASTAFKELQRQQGKI